MGDARLDYDALTYGWFDHFLKGEDNGFLQKPPKVQYFTMGINKWQHSETWPPEGAKPVTLDALERRPRQHPARRRQAQCWPIPPSSLLKFTDDTRLRLQPED